MDTPIVRNALARVPKASAEMVAANIRTIFAQPTAQLVREQVDNRRRHPRGQVPCTKPRPT
jgi:hypothetical protein